MKTAMLLCGMIFHICHVTPFTYAQTILTLGCLLYRHYTRLYLRVIGFITRIQPSTGFATVFPSSGRFSHYIYT
jgi:hypothetical protein